MKILKFIPWMAFVLIAYNLLAWTSESTIADELRATVFSAGLPSGAVFALHVSDLFLFFGLGLLYLRVLEVSRFSSSESSIDHALSMLTFVICLLEFLLYAKAGTSTFLLLTAFALLDVLAGFTVSLATARRDIAFGGN